MKDDKKKAENKTTASTIVVAIFILFAIILLSGMWGDTSTKPISETKPSESLISKESYYYDTFLKGCEKGGGKPSECQCLLTKVKQRWTFAEFEAVAKEYNNTQKMPEALVQMSNDCLEV